MGAGCCRARGLPGHHGGPGAPPPRPAWGPVWGPDSADSIADLRPGDKFRFNREPFIRQHLVVPDKQSSLNGVHNPAFTSDSGAPGPGLAVRPALPALPTPPPSPSAAPVPPPRKKRRARPPQPDAAQPAQPQGPPPLPPSRSRGGSRVRGRDGVAAADDDDAAVVNPSDSILSPAHTMELLKRMAKMESRLGRPASSSAYRSPRARSMDSLDTIESRTSRSLPGRGARAATHGSLEAPEYEFQDDGPRSLDLDLGREEGVVGVAAFSLQSWQERQERAWSPGGGGSAPPLSNSAVLLSPRQWRPLSPPPEVPPAQPLPAHVHAASTRALAAFIKDSYTAPQADGSTAPTAAAEEAETGEVVWASPSVALDPVSAGPVSAAAPQELPDHTKVPEVEGSAGSGAPAPPPPSLLVQPPPPAPTPTKDTDGALTDSAKSTGLLDVSSASTGGRPGSSASSTTESLGELEDDIMHMLSSAEGEPEDADDERQQASPTPTTLSSTDLVRQQLQQHKMGESVPVTAST